MLKHAKKQKELNDEAIKRMETQELPRVELEIQRVEGEIQRVDAELQEQNKEE